MQKSPFSLSRSHTHTQFVKTVLVRQCARLDVCDSGVRSAALSARQASSQREMCSLRSCACECEQAVCVSAPLCIRSLVTNQPLRSKQIILHARLHGTSIKLLPYISLLSFFKNNPNYLGRWRHHSIKRNTSHYYCHRWRHSIREIYLFDVVQIIS